MAISLVIITFWASGCQKNERSEALVPIKEIQIIPHPKKILYKRGFFKLDKSSKVLMDLSDDKSKIGGKVLIDQLFDKANLKLKIADVFTTTNVESAIEIISNANEVTDPEGFKIVITQNRLKIMATDSNGFFYGNAVALSLLTKTNNTWNAPQIIIEDEPKVKLRGLYINLQDSFLIDDKLIQLLKTNRINLVVTSNDWSLKNTDHIHIINNSSLDKDLNSYLVPYESIKDFYKKAKIVSDTLLFKIINSNQLHPDSLAVIGQAFWSSTANNEYQELIKKLKEKSED